MSICEVIQDIHIHSGVNCHVNYSLLKLSQTKFRLDVLLLVMWQYCSL